MTKRRKLILGTGLGVLFWLALAWQVMNTPRDIQATNKQIFRVEAGTTWTKTVMRLKQERFLDYAVLPRLYSRLLRAPLQAGEFELSAAMSPREIVSVLAYGRPILHRLHFPEGLTMWEVAQAVNATGLTTASQFLNACQDEKFLHSQGINATSAEGYLFPETYFLPRPVNQDPYPILKALLDGFKATLHTLPHTVEPSQIHNVVILASLVEKETAVAAERGLIAGVYTSRLQRGMLLQCDPTVIYGLGKTFDGNLRRTHLRDAANAYNTYVHPGLPPGPICSPGRAALLAAMNPEKHDFLYFVAKSNGTHFFSRTLREHNTAVSRYQKKPHAKSTRPKRP